MSSNEPVTGNATLRVWGPKTKDEVNRQADDSETPRTAADLADTRDTKNDTYDVYFETDPRNETEARAKYPDGQSRIVVSDSKAQLIEQLGVKKGAVEFHDLEDESLADD